jgi:hypothetical protein
MRKIALFVVFILLVTSFTGIFSFESVAQNQPPFFGTPAPENNSISNPLSFTWNIPISDPEGDTFSWTIQCNNSQTNSGTDDTNGSKSLALSGLAYLTTYTVWVNATDPTGSGLYTRIWHMFTTMSQPWSNRPPTFSNPSPVNGSTGINRYHATNITVSDLDGNSTLVCFWYSLSNSPYSWTKAQQNNSVTANTTARDINSSYSSGWNTQYWWKVTANDGHANSTVIYTFTTKWINRAPTFSSPSPTNGSTGVNRYHATNVTVSDLDGNATTVCFYYSLSNSPYSWVKSQQNNSVIANTTVRDINSSYSSGRNTQYWWRVTAYDGHVNSSVIYTFTTKQSNSPPVFGTPSPANGSTGNMVNLSWSIPINDLEGNAFSWTIQCSNGQTTSGTGAMNGTKSLTLSGLTNSTTYKIWVNATDPTGSGLYTRKWYNFTTSASLPPHKPTITGPTSGKTGVSYIYNFVTSDPKAYDVYYRIEWGDGSPITEWYGPYHSGQVIIVSQTFSTIGTFIIMCQAKNTYNTSSDWGQLQVTMPVSINLPPLFHQLLEKLFERFPHAFPILRHLLGY